MGDPENNPEARAALFQSREIRRALQNGEWWFVITDTIAALTDAANPADYWKKMLRRDPDVSPDSQGRGQIAPPLRWRLIRRVVAGMSAVVNSLVRGVPRTKLLESEGRSMFCEVDCDQNGSTYSWLMKA